MSENNLEASLEAQLKGLGDQLESTIEQFALAESEKRGELQEQIEGLQTAVEEVKESLVVERRGHLPGVEAATPESGQEGFSMPRSRPQGLQGCSLRAGSLLKHEREGDVGWRRSFGRLHRPRGRHH